MPAAQREIGDNVIQMRLDEDAIIENAIAILQRRLERTKLSLSSPTAVKQFLTMKLAQQEREVFCVLLLDSRNQLIHYEELFYGTLTSTSVYPREVVKLALTHNSGGVIFAHNHPSGNPEPSAADRALTNTLKQALALVEIRALDHIVVGGTQTVSFAERGEI